MTDLLCGTVKSLYKLALHKLPSDGTFVRANIDKTYYIRTREIVELLINNIIIINYYHYYDLQEIISLIKI